LDNETGYFAADRESADELSRLKILEQIGDPQTIQYLTAVGIGEGWRCLEVGAGAGSIVRWLCEQVGPTGHVVAADLDPRFLGDITADNVEVRRFDVTSDPLEPATYDLIHARALLTHMREPVAVLQRLVDALRPGGWLVVEDPDYEGFRSIDDGHPLSSAFDACTDARIASMAATGVMNLRYGNVLPVHIERVGLTDVGNQANTFYEHGGGPISRFVNQSFAPIDAAIVAHGVIDQSVASDAQRALDDPSFIFRSGLMVSVWGRKAV
jgi:SAM-dependent methyltransferase